MNFEEILNSKPCKYCNTLTDDVTTDILKCTECQEIVHCKCLKRGSVPGGLSGDVFFTFTCQDCSTTSNENFVRDKMSWLQVIVLVLYHMQTKSSGLARKGFFHWKIHIAAFINKYWEVLFRRDFKRKKKWTGTVAGTLSHFSPQFFQSGTSIFSEQGWWTLTYAKLTPYLITYLNSKLMARKQNLRDGNNRINDEELFRDILFEERNIISEDYFTTTSSLAMNSDSDSVNSFNVVSISNKKKSLKGSKVLVKKRSLLPTLENYTESSASKLLKLSNTTKKLQNDLTKCMLNQKQYSVSLQSQNIKTNNIKKEGKSAEKNINMLDRFCHYHTSLKQISSKKGIQLSQKIMGGIREELIYSPYSTMYLKPYIRRDSSSFPHWLNLMAEIQLKTNQNNPEYVLSPRSTIDYAYLQPEHLPAINSLCNHFFWPGIDLTECLQYPDFSCVVLYRKLIIGFAFLVPNVKLNESYLSFIFTRPGWRNNGIGRFMIYHLIQTSIGKDITLHVSINNPALFLYQKFGFKVEHVELDFYDKYVRSDTKESKHAFFCRLER